MLGIFLIYYIGKSFYKLAELYNKSPWGFAIAGVAVFYAAQILFGAVYGLWFGFDDSNRSEELMLNLLGLAVGGVVIYFFYKYLERQWSLAPIKEANPDILDDMV